MKIYITPVFKKMIVFFIYLFILISPIYNFLTVALNPPVSLVVFDSILLVLSVFIVILRILNRRKRILKDLVFVSLVIVFMTYSVFQTDRIIDIIAESQHYLLAISIYYLVEYVDVKEKSLFVVISISIVVSFLLYIMGYIVQIPFLNSNLRIAGYIDGGIGLVAIIMSLRYLFFSNRFYKVKNYILWALLFSGILIVFLSQSRSKILISLLVILLFSLFSFFKGNKVKTFRFLTIFSAIFVVISILFYNQFIDILTAVISRFSTYGNDLSSQQRYIEASIQMNIFFSKPVLGVGWGTRSSILVIGDYYMHNHNMFSTILMQMGFVGFIIYFGLIIDNFIFINNRKNVNKADVSCYKYFIFICISYFFLMSIFSAGFAQETSIILLVFIYSVKP